LSRMPRRVARTVLRGPRRGNAPGLPGRMLKLYWVSSGNAAGVACR
jgi:hypothetical protein